MPFCHILIAKPPVNVSTKLVYEKLDNTDVKLHPDIDGIIEAIKLKDVALVASRMGNVLESVTVPLYPVIDSIKKDMIEHGAMNDHEKGLAMAIARHYFCDILGMSRYDGIFKKYLPKETKEK